MGLVDSYSVDKGRGDVDANGFIWRALPLIEGSDQDVKSLLQQKFTQDEFKQHVNKTGILEYQQQVKNLLDQTVNEHGQGLLVGLHSIPAYRTSKLTNGEFKGTYVLSEPAVPGNSPDLFLIANGGASASPEFIKLAIDIAKGAGLKIFPGTGPLRGDIGSTALYANPQAGSHVLGFEFMGYEGLEPGRLKGKILPPSESKKLSQINRFLNDFLNKAEKLTKKDVSNPNSDEFLNLFR